jgi:dihydrofolate reductase
MILSIIAAVGKNNELGKDNKLLWHISDDLKRFKKLTMGHTMIMGRKTFESIGKALPGRKTVIISRNLDYKIEGCETFSNIEDAINAHKNEKEIFVTGGGEIYKQMLEKSDKIYLTKVHVKMDADTFFPEIDEKKWKIESKESFQKGGKNEFDFDFINFSKI